jgi:hypothetical protein
MNSLLSSRRVRGAGAAIALAGCLATAALPVSAGEPKPPRAAQGTPLPDLTVGVARLRSSMIISNRTFTANSCSFVEGCVSTTGSRRLLLFDMQIINEGNADAVLGNPTSNPELFEWSPCHGHYHMTDTLDYSLTHGGRDSVAVYNSQSGTFFLKNRNDSGSADVTFLYGAGGAAIPLSGDWDGDGDATVGLYDPVSSTFFLKNTNAAGNADVTFIYGTPGQMKPIVGDWDGSGTDTIGLYDPATGSFFLKNTNAAGNADLTFQYGVGGAALPLSADWNGDDVDTVGLYDPASGTFFLKNTNGVGPADTTFIYGSGGALLPVSGDWNVDGVDTIGVYNPVDGTFFLRNENSSGEGEEVFTYGGPAGGVLTALTNDWDYDRDGETIPGYVGLKQAFCWLDSQRVYGSLPPRYNCGNQGITAGWSDIYGRSLDCQWVDITGLPAGNYQLRVSVNDTQTIVQESDYSDNHVALKVHITAPGSSFTLPKVTVTAPTAGKSLRVGKPATITWTVENPENMTHQEIWLLPAPKKKQHGQDPDDADAIAQAKLLVENLPASARSYTWTPTDEDVLRTARIMIRTTDSRNMVGTDTVNKGRFHVKGRK